MIHGVSAMCPATRALGGEPAHDRSRRYHGRFASSRFIKGMVLALGAPLLVAACNDNKENQDKQVETPRDNARTSIAPAAKGAEPTLGQRNVSPGPSQADSGPGASPAADGGRADSGHPDAGDGGQGDAGHSKDSGTTDGGAMDGGATDGGATDGGRKTSEQPR